MEISNISSNMNATAGVDSVSGASVYVPSADSARSQMRSSIVHQSQNFKALRVGLETGDLAAAQSAFATLTQQIQNSSQAAGGKSPFDSNSPIGKDYQTLGAALKSGDLAGAQSAFASFRQDMRVARHQHPHASPAASSNYGVSSNSGGTSRLDAVA